MEYINIQNNKILADNMNTWEKYHRKKPIKQFNLNQTMYTLVTNESKGYEDYPAIGFLGTEISFGELLNSANTLAQAFKNAGVKNGDNVAVLTVSTPVVQECLLALSKIGAVQSWIDLRCKEKDLIKYINNSECRTIVVMDMVLPLIQNIIDQTNVTKVIVSSPKDYLSPVLKIAAQLKDKREGKAISIPDDNRFISYSKFMKTGVKGEPVIPAPFEKEKISVVVQSSGSTGKPKQIAHTEYNFNVAAYNGGYLDFPYFRGTVMHNPVPPFIIYGLASTIYVAMAFTMKCELHPQVEDSSVFDDLGKFEISLAAPVHYRYIYKKIAELQQRIKELEGNVDKESQRELNKKNKELKRIEENIGKVKLFVSGGDKMSFEEHMEMQHKFNKVIVNGYGNNECMGAAMVSPIYANKPGTVGIPMHRVKTLIVDPESGIINKNGICGEVYISSDCIFKEYINNTEETAQNRILDNDGNAWIRTGDLGYIDNAGYVVITGRSRRLIKKDAFKISPDAIENVILELPFVSECVVVGVDDPENISVPMAFFVLNDSSKTLEEAITIIRDKCYEDLPDYEVPSYFEMIDSIPYTKNNKYDFKALEIKGNEIVARL